MADNEHDNHIEAETIQPTVTENSVSDPSITVIEPDTQKVTEVEGETVTRASQPVLVEDASLHDEKPSSVEGEPNGLPPAAPMVQLEPPVEVKALREWEHLYLNKNVHTADSDHMHVLHQHIEAICARLHGKYPVQK
jgi:hypothetical protein